jgi:uncharacterized membrane protein
LALLRAQRRFAFSVLVSVVTVLFVPTSLGWTARLVAGWDTGSLAMLALTWWVIIRSNPRQTRRRAASQDPGRTLIWLIVLASCACSLFAAVALVNQARLLAPAHKLLFVGFCLGAVASSWLLTHSAYALRYAHLYYRPDDEGEGGLTFPGDLPPDDWDFAYFAFTLGMCFQTSDVCVTSPTIRRYVLIHAILSFGYNTAILALALNLAFSLFD